MSDKKDLTKDMEFETPEGLHPGIIVYRGGRWGMAGGPGNMMLHHDRSNSAV